MKVTRLPDFDFDPKEYGGYTAEEIYGLWRGAKCPDYEIKILSQLCCCSKRRIVSVLNFMRKDEDPPLPKRAEARANRSDKYYQTRGMSETTRLRIIEDFQMGTSLENISEKQCVSYSKVYGVLRESGILKGRCTRISNREL